MTPTENLINRFYTCFKNSDYKGMQACYSDKARFSDPVFQQLSATEVKAMWEMLCKRAKDLDLEFGDIKANETEGSASWTADYTFSQTGKKVTNHIKARFKFENGLIVEHNDHFNFYNWSRQAFGLPGLLLGWTPFMKKKVRASARKGLNAFMNKSSGQ